MKQTWTLEIAEIKTKINEKKDQIRLLIDQIAHILETINLLLKLNREISQEVSNMLMQQLHNPRNQGIGTKRRRKGGRRDH